MSALACARIALRAAVIATVFVSGARAANATDTTVSKAELQAKIAYCENCHGVSARDFTATTRSRGWRDSNPNTSRTNWRHFSSIGERTISCSTLLMCLARQCWTL